MQRTADLFSLENCPLVEAALTHESILSRDEAQAKFGINQQILAAKGDAKLKVAIVDYVHEHGLEFAQQQAFEKNLSLLRWAKSPHVDIVSEIKLDRSNFRSSETYTHAIGTAVEALFELVHANYGDELFRLFVEHNYFRWVLDNPEPAKQVKVSPQVTCATPANPKPVTKTTLDLVEEKPTRLVNPRINHPMLREIKRQVKALYARKVTWTHTKGSAEHKLLIQFHVGTGAEAMPMVFRSTHTKFKPALEDACSQALHYLKQVDQAVA